MATGVVPRTVDSDDKVKTTSMAADRFHSERVRLVWSTAEGLAALAGRPVRLRFILPRSQCLPAEDWTMVTPLSRRIAGVPATYTLPPENAIRLPWLTRPSTSTRAVTGSMVTRTLPRM